MADSGSNSKGTLLDARDTPPYRKGQVQAAAVPSASIPAGTRDTPPESKFNRGIGVGAGSMKPPPVGWRPCEHIEKKHEEKRR